MGEQHSRFSAALAQLADTAGLTRALDVSDNRPDWWPAGMTWRQTLGRFDPENTAFATLALETVDEPTVIVLVKAHVQVSEQTPIEAWHPEIPGIGVLQVRAFPDDPRFPTLASVAHGARRVRVVRYRPGKRCTLRIGSDGAFTWAKVFSDGSGGSIQRSQEALWAASDHGELDVAVAHRCASIPRRGPCGSGTSRPIHGAPHPEQWLDEGGRLGLIDFDRFSLADRELDIATFQAEVDFEFLPASLRNDVNDAFRSGYESQAGRMDTSLLRAYRIHKRLAKVLRTTRAIRPDGDARAARHLAGVTELLRGAAS